MNAESSIFIFVKYPQPGHVKTRLAERIGHAAAATVYRDIVELFLRRFQSIFQDHCTIYFDPAEEEERIRYWLGDRYAYAPQPPGDLGRRLSMGFDRMLANSQRVIALGSDSPDLPLDYVKQAIDALPENDLVIGPATDGGYYLIGLSRPMPELFENVPWSTNKVFELTLSKANEQGASIHVLPQWHDIDYFEDLGKLRISADPEIRAFMKRYAGLFQT